MAYAKTDGRQGGMSELRVEWRGVRPAIDGLRSGPLIAEQRKELTMRTDIDIKRDVEAELRITNLIEISPRATATDIKRKIEEVLSP